MDLLGRTNVLTKLRSINLIIAVIVGGCIWFAQSRMTRIDEVWASPIAREAKAVSNGRRSNRLHNTINYLMYRTIAETDPQQIRPASAQFDAIVGRSDKALSDLERQVPAFSHQIQAQRRRTASFVADASEARCRAKASEETGSAATQVLASASELSRQSDQLSVEVDGFLDGAGAA